MNSNAHFEYVRHKYLLKLISWVAVYTNKPYIIYLEQKSQRDFYYLQKSIAGSEKVLHQR